MIPSARLPDVPSSPVPPGEGRQTGYLATWQADRAVAAIDGGTGIGVPTPPASSYETRPGRRWSHVYLRDQSLGQTWTNDGQHVVVGLHPGWPQGDHEPFAALQRPMFRVPAAAWYAPAVEEA